MDNLNKEELRATNYNGKIVFLNPVNEKLLILRVKPHIPFSYKPGQYTTLGLGAWEEKLPDFSKTLYENLTKVIRRAYSISSPLLSNSQEVLERPKDDSIEFYINLVEEPHAELTPRLFNYLRDPITIGEETEFSEDQAPTIAFGKRIVGNYNLDLINSENTDLVLLASTGTGGAPNYSIASNLLNNGYSGKIAFIECSRFKKDLGYSEKLSNLEKLFPEKIIYQNLTTRDLAEDQEKIYIQDLLKKDLLQKKISDRWSKISLDSSKTHVFLCGNPDMIGAPKIDRETRERKYPETLGLTEILEKEYGFTLDTRGRIGNLHFEEYW
jgi:ferredoxin/flavodoxin---NADP+ reductase